MLVFACFLSVCYLCLCARISISVISSLTWCVCVCMFLYMFLFACVFVCVCVHAFSISVISSLTWCTKSGWGRLGRQPISRPPQYLEQYAGNMQIGAKWWYQNYADWQEMFLQKYIDQCKKYSFVIPGPELYGGPRRCAMRGTDMLQRNS